MKKLWISLILTAALMLVLAVTVSADREVPLLIDDAGLLEDYEYESLLSKLEEISERQEAEVGIITLENMQGYSSVVALTDDIYDEFGYGWGEDDDGVLLLIAMDEREWHISTHGWAVYALTDYGLSLIEDAFLDDLSDGYYYDAFCAFADRVDEFFTIAYEGEPVDVGSYSEPFNVPQAVIISLIIGIVGGFVYVGSLKSSMTTVKMAQNAKPYVDENSLTLTKQSDRFLYAKTTRVARNTSSSSGGGSSTHRSSSGRSHGGRSGRF